MGTDGLLTGSTRTILRVEGAALALAAVAGFWWTGQSWWLFVFLFLAPDLGMAAYLAGPRLGALGYNLVHTTTLPLALAIAGLAMQGPLTIAVAALATNILGLNGAPRRKIASMWNSSTPAT